MTQCSLSLSLFSCTHRSHGISDVLLLVLVLVDVSDAERVPELGLVPEARVQHALHRVARHVGRRQGQET